MSRRCVVTGCTRFVSATGTTPLCQECRDALPKGIRVDLDDVYRSIAEWFNATMKHARKRTPTVAR